MNTKLEEIKNTIDELLADRTATRQKYEAKIEAAEKMKAEATDKMELAYLGTNPSEYHKAQDELRTSEDMIKMYKTKLDSLSTDASITPEEYNKLLTDITRIQLEEVTKGKKEVIELIDKTAPIYDRTLNTIEDGNKLIYDLQVKLAKDPKVVTPSGDINIFSLRQFNDRRLIWLINSMRESNLYKEYKNELEGR